MSSSTTTARGMMDGRCRRRSMSYGWIVRILVAFLVAATQLQCQSAAFASSSSQHMSTISSRSTVTAPPVSRANTATASLTKKSRVVLTTTKPTTSSDELDNKNKDDEETEVEVDVLHEEDGEQLPVVRVVVNTTTTTLPVMRGGASGTVGTHAPPALPTVRQYRNFAVPCTYCILL
jgi:hypothetical protein